MKMVLTQPIYMMAVISEPKHVLINDGNLKIITSLHQHRLFFDFLPFSPFFAFSKEYHAYRKGIKHQFRQEKWKPKTR